MQPESVAARVWPRRAVELEPLDGGITNRNFKVLVDGDAYVLRIGGSNTELLGVDRRAEHVSARAAAAAGAGPEVVAFDEGDGVLVTRFVEGRALTNDELRAPATIALVAETLKKFHDGPTVPSRFASFQVVASYAAAAEGGGAVLPAAYQRASRIAERIRRLRGTYSPHLCHNDLLGANFVFDGTRIWIVDWEYAGMGDVFFDLANYSVNNGLDADEDDELLRAYFGTRRERDAAVLAAMRFMSDFREAMWGVVQQAISELEFDFAEYAGQHFDRLERTAAAPRFRAALHTLEES